MRSRRFSSVVDCRCWPVVADYNMKYDEILSDVISAQMCSGKPKHFDHCFGCHWVHMEKEFGRHCDLSMVPCISCRLLLHLSRILSRMANFEQDIISVNSGLSPLPCHHATLAAIIGNHYQSMIFMTSMTSLPSWDMCGSRAPSYA